MMALLSGARTLIIVSAVLPVLASLAVALRVHLRKASKSGGLGTSEYLIFACIVSFIDFEVIRRC